jgi:peptidoglycan/LPS O-acetylase OafA/YrhL
MTRIPTLDGWRGVAILLVLVDHASRALNLSSVRTGLHGVTFFFVLSGFLITTRLQDENRRSGRIDLLTFYRRRCFRLMPVAWLYLLVAFFLSPNRTDAVRGTLAAVFFFRNLIHIDGLSLTGHFWSLSIEEQFYLAWPLTLVFAGFRRGLWIAIIGAVALTLWRLSLWLPGMDFPTRTDFHADALLIGCIAAILLPRLKPHLRQWMIYPLLLAAMLNIASYSNIIPTKESVVLALLLMVTSTFGNPVLEMAPLRFIGAISYSLYVWQQPFMFIKYNTVAACVAGSILPPALAIASFYFLEQPMIAFAKRKHRHVSVSV